MFEEQKHQRLGSKLLLLLTANCLRLSLENQLGGKSVNFIQGSEMKQNSGL
jgi:hypothetical protein